MAKLIIEDTTLTNIADAIRSKNGESIEYLPSQMPAKIEAIEGGGGTSGGGGYEIKYRNNGIAKLSVEELAGDIAEGKWIDGYRMFYQNTSLSDFSFFTEGIFRPTSCEDMFYNCTGMKDIDVSNFDTSKVLNMYRMFYYATNLKALNGENWDVSNVTNMSSMFNQTGIEDFSFLKNWDVSKATTVYSMFWNNECATELDLSNWNLASCTTYVNFIAGFTELTKLRLPNLPKFGTTEKVFWSCPNLYDIQFANGGTFGNTVTTTATLNLAAFWKGDQSTEVGEGTYGSYYEAFANSIGENTSGATKNIKLYTTLFNSLTDEQKALLTDKGYTITYGTS